MQIPPSATRPPRQLPAAADPQLCGPRIDWVAFRAIPIRFLSSRPGSCRSWFVAEQNIVWAGPNSVKRHEAGTTTAAPPAGRAAAAAGILRAGIAVANTVQSVSGYVKGDMG